MNDDDDDDDDDDDRRERMWKGTNFKNKNLPQWAKNTACTTII